MGGSDGKALNNFKPTWFDFLVWMTDLRRPGEASMETERPDSVCGLSELIHVKHIE